MELYLLGRVCVHAHDPCALCLMLGRVRSGLCKRSLSMRVLYVFVFFLILVGCAQTAAVGSGGDALFCVFLALLSLSDG